MIPVDCREVIVEVNGVVWLIPDAIEVDIDAIELGIGAGILEEPCALSEPNAAFDNRFGFESLHNKPCKEHVR